MQKRLLSSGLIAGILLAWLMAASPVTAQAQGALKLSASAGFDGLCVLNHWLPVRVQLENSGPAVDGLVEVRSAAADSRSSLYDSPVSLPQGARKQVTVQYFADGYLDGLDVRLVAAGQTIAQAQARVNCSGEDSRLVGVLAGDPNPFAGLAATSPEGNRLNLAVLTPGDLPENAAALRALSALVISGADTGQLTGSQVQGLQSWVSDGGQLLVIGGSAWQPAAAGITDLLPMRPSGTRNLSGLQPLAALAGSSDRLDGAALVASGDLAPGGRVLVEQDGAPLVTARRTGLGQVIYLAADPASEPLKSWPGRTDLLRALLIPQARPAWSGSIWNWDSAGSAIASLPNQGLPSGWLVASFLVIYILAVGPANFFLLRRLKRRELAWITIPAVVVVCSSAAFAVGSWGRGRQPVLHRLAVVQSEAGQPLGRVDGLLGIYSPRRASLSAVIERGYLVSPLPGLTVMQRRGGWVFNQDGESTRLADLHLDVGGINAVVVQGYTPAPPLEVTLNLNLDNHGATLTGALVNTGSLPLQGAVLLFPGGKRQLGDIQPGEQRGLDAALPEDSQAIPAEDLFNPSGMAKFNPLTASNLTSTLVYDLVGSSDYYKNQDTYRRYMLVMAALGNVPPQTAAAGPETGSIYLGAWSAASPIPASIPGQDFTPLDLSLNLVRLPANIVVQPGAVRLPPALYTWQAIEIDPANPTPLPYDAQLGAGSSRFRFRLVRPMKIQAVKALVLHLKGRQNSGPTGLRVALWDFEKDEWTFLPDSAWGDYPVVDPQRYVDRQGEVRLRLDSGQTTTQGLSIPLQRADFTLEAEVVSP